MFHHRSILTKLLGLAALLLMVPALWPQADDADPAVPEGVEVLARGPVHEAFAEPASSKAKPAPAVPKAPPEAIDEVPPDQKPEGNVQWLPGYWSWDEERNDYLWVSGFWRVPPPGRQWVPGHWKQVAGGWQWTAGFWAAQDQKELTYLPPPPEPLEAGPSVPAPSAEHVYVSGSWVYRGGRYAWRPGFWVEARPGWVWVPSHYVWTSGGYVYVDGYWDYTLRDRGLLFAPAYIDVAVIRRPGWYYTPTYVIHDDCLVGALFVRPGYSCYYFGDYFEPCYRRSGYVAFYEVSYGGRCCDPLFSYYSFHYRSDPGWSISLRFGYDSCYRGTCARPPRTLIQQKKVVKNTTIINNNTTIINNNSNNNNTTNNTTNNNAETKTMLAPLSSASKKGMAMKPVTKESQQEMRASAKELAKAGQQRNQVETQLMSQGPPKANDLPRVGKVDLPKAARMEKQDKVAPPSLEPQRNLAGKQFQPKDGKNGKGPDLAPGNRQGDGPGKSAGKQDGPPKQQFQPKANNPPPQQQFQPKANNPPQQKGPSQQPPPRPRPDNSNRGGKDERKKDKDR